MGIPAEDVARLAELWAAGDASQLDFFCAMLSRRGWSYGQIGAGFPTPVSRQRIAVRVGRVHPGDVADVLPDPRAVPEAVERSNPLGHRRRRVQELDLAQRAMLRLFGDAARGRRAGMAADDPAMVASANLSALLLELHDEQNVAVAVLAKAVGVTPAAVGRKIRAARAARAAASQ